MSEATNQPDHESPEAVTRVGSSVAPRRSRRPTPGAIAGLIVVLAAIVQLSQVDHRLDLGNGDFYLRNAATYAGGSFARSRYSPGLGIFLSPLARIAGADYRLLTFLAEFAMVVVATGALFVLYRLLRTWVAPWSAVIVLAAFALGQSGAVFLNGAEPEALALLLVTGCLLTLARDRPWWAIALGGLAVGVRVSLVPFVVTLFLLLLVRHRRAGAVGLLSVALATAAHFASGPRVDQSYVGISAAVYGTEDGVSSNVLARVADAVLTRAVNYLKVGIPRLVVPSRLLDSPVGPVIAVVVVAAILFGIYRQRRDRREPLSGSASWVFDSACLAALALLAALLFWPAYAGDSTRLLIPIIAVPLVGLGRSLEVVRRPAVSIGVARIGSLCLAAFLVVNVAAMGSALADRRDPAATDQRFLAVHERSRSLRWSGPVISRKPAFTELTTGRVSYSYPVGDDATRLEALARRTMTCTFVIDELYDGMPNSTIDWVQVREDRVIAAVGSTRIVTIRAPWCPTQG